MNPLIISPRRSARSARIALFAVADSLSFCGSSLVTIVHVCADQPSIQARIDAADDNDTVPVAPGTYFESISISGKTTCVSSHSRSGSDPSYIAQTEIDGNHPAHPDTASCMMMVSGEGPSTVLQGFTLTNGNGTVWTDPHGAGADDTHCILYQT